jgi:hypothetical protein
MYNLTIKQYVGRTYCTKLSCTIGNSMIDEFIQYTQLNANDSTNYFEWIEFDQIRSG